MQRASVVQLKVKHCIAAADHPIRNWLDPVTPSAFRCFGCCGFREKGGGGVGIFVFVSC